MSRPLNDHARRIQLEQRRAQLVYRVAIWGAFVGSVVMIASVLLKG